MILRRIMDHVKAQNWTAIALDFVIVVSGVFIGIQVSNWNEARVNHKTERAYLELLRRDLQSTMADVEEQAAFEKFQAETANSIWRLIEETPSEERHQKLGMLFSQLSARRTLKIDSPTFLDLQSSGKLGLISDPALRNDIVRYFFRIRRWESVIEKNNANFVDRSFNDYVASLGVGSWAWDPKLMKATPPSGVTDYAGLKQERMDPALLTPQSPKLMNPPDSPVWDGARERLSFRASIAVTNENFANLLMTATVQIENEIAAYLDGDEG